MRAWKTIRLRCRSLLRPWRVERDLADELRDHLERQIELHVRAGLPPADARARALREFGNVALVEEQCRDTRKVTWLEDLLRDIAYALRSIRRAWVHTAVAGLSLAVAIAANTTTFSVVNTLLLRDLPVADPQDLAEIGLETSSGPGSFSYVLYERVRDENRTLTDLIAVSSPVTRAEDDGSDRPPLGRYVSGNFFDVLGIAAVHGRLLTSDDERPGSEAGGMVAVVSYGLWHRKWGGDSGVIGKSLVIGAQTPGRTPPLFTIVGVLPPTFTGLTVGRSDDFYLPLASEPRVSPRSLLNAPSAGWLKVLGRMRPDASRDAVKADVGVIHARFVDAAASRSSEALTRQRRAQRVTVGPARTGLAGPRLEFERPVRLLMGAVALVLLVACANVINLLLARGLARRGELAVRQAIGASRGRLVRQLLAESTVLGLIGGTIGLVLAYWGTSRVGVLMANEDPAVAYDLAPDTTVLLFTLVVSLGCALAAGLLPALRVSRPGAASFRDGATARGGRTMTIWARGLIASQVALSLVLLAGALLLLTTLRNFQTGDFGFDRGGVLTMRLDPARAGYTEEQRLEHFRASVQRVREMPGVRAAALALGMPVISAGVDTSFGIEGQPRDPDALVFVNDVTDGYFATTGTRLLRGRDFGAQDGRRSSPVAIINDALARRYFGGSDPIGQRIVAGIRGTLEVVGIVETTKYESLRESDSPIVYVHALQRSGPGGLNLVVKTEGDPSLLGSTIRRALQAAAPVRVSPPETLSSQIDRTLVKERLIARVLSVFAFVAVALAAAGLYGVLAWSVTRRTGEIGVRLALGATRGAVLRPVLAESTRLVALGVAIGIPAALALSGALSNVLFGVAPTDVRVLGAVVLCLFGVALVAASVPASRAARVNPLVALREE
jgi:predicted permease